MTDEKLEQAKMIQVSIKSLSDLLPDCKKEKEIYMKAPNAAKAYALTGEIVEK